jgi:O-antigen ligase
MAGLSGFYMKYSGYFAKKTNSATARMDYWQAAWQLFKEKPLFGSGPGTFQIGYHRLKRPESEPTKLAHNDYLQQASDSGGAGACSYAALILGSVVVLYQRLRHRKDRALLALWLGVAGLAAQEVVEFSLYIPALAWPLFLFLGFLWSVVSEPSESAHTAGSTRG